MEALVGMMSGQSWFAMVGQGVLIANMLTMFISDNFMKGNPILGKVNDALNFASLNIFKNKNEQR